MRFEARDFQAMDCVNNTRPTLGPPALEQPRGERGGLQLLGFSQSNWTENSLTPEESKQIQVEADELFRFKGP